MRDAYIFKSRNSASCYPVNWLQNHSWNKTAMVYLKLWTIAIDFHPQSGNWCVYSKALEEKESFQLHK